MTRNETIYEIYNAWTQGGYPELYSNRAECREWLEDVKTEEIQGAYFQLSDLSSDELDKLAEELCSMYEKE